MRIASNKYSSVMSFALNELKDIYPESEIQALVYYLFEEFLGVNRTSYILNKQKGMSESELLKFNFALKDLKKGKPIQHILGFAYFLNRRFKVSKDTLIPRPETEELVQLIQTDLKNLSHLKILDIGTGTGCIPISLALEMQQHQYFALDFKEEIINLAKENTALHQVKIDFKTLDILKAKNSDLQKYDIIISNPPYVLESEKATMHQNVTQYEPGSALYIPDEKALMFYEKITQLAATNLLANGKLYFEINERKAQAVISMLKSYGFYQISLHQDIHNKDRFIRAYLKPFSEN